MTTLVAPSPVSSLLHRYSEVRSFTERLCAPLGPEDQVIQSMPDVSPTKWHLAHTSWFFETFVLKSSGLPYTEANPAFAFLFNSYYTQAGARHCRAQRGYISRPTVPEVLAYRRHVDGAVHDLLVCEDAELVARLAPLVELGLHHEQQHQELILSDIKHVLSVNPLRPAYHDGAGPSETVRAEPSPLEWISFAGGLERIGHEGPEFAFDNEMPRHRTYIEPFSLGSRLVTNGEFLEFMEDGGYDRPKLWLSLGWQVVEANGWRAPFYWEERDGAWWLFTLSGLRPLDRAEPAVHLSYFEADAYARWAGARVPTEAEWEVAASDVPVSGNFAEQGRLHPAAADPVTRGVQQLYGDVWEWTQSPYVPYPGFRSLSGTLGEYNGKFMCNQLVLRGGSCASPAGHIRPTYRNFFPPEATWQFTGLRLARDA